MKLKLDQNLGTRGSDLFMAAGHDVCTALAQGLDTAPDEELWQRTTADGRVLVTPALDFADTLRFPPSNHPGMAVLRVPEHRGSSLLLQIMRTLVLALHNHDIGHNLWVVEPGRIRVYEEEGNP